MKDLKAGDVTEFAVGNEKLIVEPMPFGKLKKLIKIIGTAGKRFDPKTFQDDMLTVVPTLVEDYVDECFPLLFNAKTHPFLNREWIDENMTVPKLKEILIAAAAVNGLVDFFLKTVRAPAPVPVAASTSGTTETPSESIGSITSSGSPTDGDPKTLTS